MKKGITQEEEKLLMSIFTKDECKFITNLSKSNIQALAWACEGISRKELFDAKREWWLRWRGMGEKGICKIKLIGLALGDALPASKADLETPPSLADLIDSYKKSH